MHLRRLGAVPYLMCLDMYEVIFLPTGGKMCREEVKAARQPPVDLQV